MMLSIVEGLNASLLASGGREREREIEHTPYNLFITDSERYNTERDLGLRET